MDSLNILIGFEPFWPCGLTYWTNGPTEACGLEPIGTSSKDGKLGLASLGWDFVGRDFIQLLVTDQRVMHDNFLDKILF